MAAPPSPPNPAAPARPSLRDVAAQAGVSAMTVSKALRNLPKVSARTRRRILRIAARLGYRPDPEITRLMHHMRRRTRPTFQALICAITDRPVSSAHPYHRGLSAGAERRARSLGYGFDLVNFDADVRRQKQLRRIVWARGAQGILLLPLREPIELDDILPWAEYSTVGVSLSLLRPAVHRAIPNHFANTLQICRKLAEFGYRRPGLVIDSDQELRVNHAFSAAVVRHQIDDRRGPVRPFVYQRLDSTGLRQWFRRERPDAIIATDDSFCREYARILELSIPGAVGFASTNTSATSPIAGIDELPGEVGAMAVDLLTGMIQHGERGLPRHPATTELHGLWHAGISCPRRSQG